VIREVITRRCFRPTCKSGRSPGDFDILGDPERANIKVHDQESRSDPAERLGVVGHTAKEFAYTRHTGGASTFGRPGLGAAGASRRPLHRRRVPSAGSPSGLKRSWAARAQTTRDHVPLVGGPLTSAAILDRRNRFASPNIRAKAREGRDHLGARLRARLLHARLSRACSRHSGR